MSSLTSAKFSFTKTNFEDFQDLQEELRAFLSNPKNKEKRRRTLANLMFQRIFSQATYFDFFTKEVIHALLLSKKIAQILKEREVSEDLLFLSFCLNSYGKISYLLEKQKISKKKIIQNYLKKKKYKNLSKETKKDFEKKLLNLVSQSVFFHSLKKKLFGLLKVPTYFFSILKKNLKSKRVSTFKYSSVFKLLFKVFFFKRPLKDIPFSYKMHIFLQNLMEIAQEKYKTPVISTDLISLVLFESKSAAFIKSQFSNEISFYEFKYALIKSLYEEESTLKEELPRNQYYFAYLLKSEISESLFQKIVKQEDLLALGDLKSRTFSIRDFLVKKIVKVNIFKSYQTEILKCVFINSNLRVYKDQ